MCNVNNWHATLNPQFENSNRDSRIHSRLVRCHVWDPDKDGLPYLEIVKGWLKDSIFTRQHKMAHELLSSLLVNQKRTF